MRTTSCESEFQYQSLRECRELFRLTLTNPSAYPRIGVVLDADTDVEKRWRQLVDILKSSNKYDCDGLDLPSDGLVLYPLNDYDAVVGIWIMPNNRFEGMLEDFALNMIPTEDLLIRKVEVGLSELEASASLQGKNTYVLGMAG